jgi:hypothetical protein
MLLRPESSLISCNILPRINNRNGVLLEVERDEILQEPKVERIVPLCYKTCCRLARLSLEKRLACGQEMAVAWRRYGKITRI